MNHSSLSNSFLLFVYHLFPFLPIPCVACLSFTITESLRGKVSITISFKINIYTTMSPIYSSHFSLLTTFFAFSPFRTKSNNATTCFTAIPNKALSGLHPCSSPACRNCARQSPSSSAYSCCFSLSLSSNSSTLVSTLNINSSLSIHSHPLPFMFFPCLPLTLPHHPLQRSNRNPPLLSILHSARNLPPHAPVPQLPRLKIIPNRSRSNPHIPALPANPRQHPANNILHNPYNLSPLHLPSSSPPPYT